MRFDSAWWVLTGPNGGYVGAVLVRAMEAELGAPERQLRSLTVHYLSAPEEGPGEVEVRVERSGRSLSTLSARLSSGGRLRALALAAFSGPYPSPATWDDAAMPAVPPADTLPVPPERDDIPPFARNFRLLPALGSPAFSGAAEAHTGGWMALREEGGELDAPFVVALADSWWPAPFARLDRPVAAPTIDLTVHVRAPLPRATEPVLGEFRSRTARDGFFEEDGRLWTADGTLLAQARQLALLR